MNQSEKTVKRPIEVIREYKELLETLPSLISKSGFKDTYIYEKMGMRRDLYYRRKKNPEVFSVDELEKLFEIISKSEEI